jgi:hypothetical protein
MTNDEAQKAMDEYWEVVKNKPISKDWPKHLITGFGIEETTPGYYELYVLGQDKNGLSSFKKTLKQWFTDNDEI